MARVVVGLSGGVDSSVAAALLLEQGHEVIGVFMRNWDNDAVIKDDECPWIEDSNDALLVAEKLGIPFQVVDLSAAYKKRIVDYMFKEYERGRTPNPDVLCNREIKFDAFLEVALSLGAEFVATGHYCQKTTEVIGGKEIHKLIAGADLNKDQSYFLCQVSQDQLSKALFPIGHLEKPVVREIAAKYDLITAGKKDSQGLCFVGKISLPDFLQQKLKSKKGKAFEIAAEHPMYTDRSKQSEQLNSVDKIVFDTLPRIYSEQDGNYKGDHIGAHFFTIGQRKGIGIGGSKLPLFVIGTDVETNTVYLGAGEDHPGLFKNSLKVHANEINWLRPDCKIRLGESLKVQCRIRYRQPLVEATLHLLDEGLFIQFQKPMKGITPGQFAAWYNTDKELLGSGVIA